VKFEDTEALIMKQTEMNAATFIYNI